MYPDFSGDMTLGIRQELSIKKKINPCLGVCKIIKKRMRFGCTMGNRVSSVWLSISVLSPKRFQRN